MLRDCSSVARGSGTGFDVTAIAVYVVVPNAVGNTSEFSLCDLLLWRFLLNFQSLSLVRQIAFVAVHSNVDRIIFLDEEVRRSSFIVLLLARSSPNILLGENEHDCCTQYKAVWKNRAHNFKFSLVSKR